MALSVSASTVARSVAFAGRHAANLSVCASQSAPAGSPSGRERGDLAGASKLASLRKGTGYRSSFSGLVTTVFGASGCIGRAVCNRLGKGGSQIIVPYRGDHYKYMRLKPCTDLGQLLFTPYHLKDEESIRRSLRYSNVAINLVGSEWPTKNFSLRDVHVTGAARLARIAKECGVERFIHISHINAREKPPKLWSLKGSEFLRSKWEGEAAVFKEFPDATIFRPVEFYGFYDTFLYNLFSFGRCGLERGTFPFWKKGEDTIKAPLHFSDLASGIMNAIDDPTTKGEIFEAYGPEMYLMSDFMDWMASISQRDVKDYGYKRVDLRLCPTAIAKSLIIGNLPIGTAWLGKNTIDRLERSNMSDHILGLPNLEDLGVKASTVKERMGIEIRPYRAFSHWMPQSTAEEIPEFDLKPLDKVQIKAIKEKAEDSPLRMLGLVVD